MAEKIRREYAGERLGPMAAGLTVTADDVATHNLAKDLAERMSEEFEKEGVRGAVALNRGLTAGTISTAWQMFHSWHKHAPVELVVLPDFTVGSIQIRFRDRIK